MMDLQAIVLPAKTIAEVTELTIALNFLRQGLAVEIITQGTGLTIEQVQALQAQVEGS